MMSLIRWLALLLLVLISPIPLLGDDGDDTPKLRVLTYNIHHAEGTDGVVDYDRLVKMILDLSPDIVALQEVDQGTRRVGGVAQLDLLAERTGMQGVFGAAMPYAGGHYGLGILSRFSMDEVKTYPLPFNFGQEPRALLEATLHPDNGLPSLVFLDTHLCHKSEENRTQQVKEIRRHLSGRDAQPMILAGDFNARPGSAPMLTMLEDGWVDAVSPQSVIDYVLIRKRDEWRVSQVEIIDDLIVSDHRPVLVELEWLGRQNRFGNRNPESVEDLRHLETELQTSIADVEQAIVAIDGGTGGGVIVSPDGYVLTAAHVSGFGRKVRVRLADGTRYDGQSLGAYRFADAAMVKIDGEGPFPFVPMALQGETRVGDWCFALGHPGGLDGDRGVVARIGRVISKTENLLRSDCRIIGGDSGCALFSSHGELIGIHSRIGMPLDQNYHAPIDAFHRYWTAMREGDVVPPQRLRRGGGLGIRSADAHPGVRVLEVRRDESPLRKGDVIRRFGEYTIEDDWELLVAISSVQLGDAVPIMVRRDGSELELEVTIRRTPRQRRE